MHRKKLFTSCRKVLCSKEGPWLTIILGLAYHGTRLKIFYALNLFSHIWIKDNFSRPKLWRISLVKYVCHILDCKYIGLIAPHTAKANYLRCGSKVEFPHLYVKPQTRISGDSKCRTSLPGQEASPAAPSHGEA